MDFFEYAFYEADHPPLHHQLVYLAFAMCIIVPMTLINNMAIFVKVSAFANVLIVMTLGCVTCYAVDAIASGTPESVAARNSPFHIENTPTVIGVAIYAFEAVGVILTLKNSMEKIEKFKR